MRPTRRGVAVLVTAAILVALGVWLGYPLLTVLGAAGLGAVAAALLVVRRAPGVEVTRTINPDQVERGRPASAVIDVRPPGATVEVRDTIGGRTTVVRTSGRSEYPLRTDVRGRFTAGPIEVGREDPLGLALGRHRTGGPATLVVYPRQLPARPGSAVDNRWRGGTELLGLREYEPGDELRHLHWKATAHTGRLMVRELGGPRRVPLTVVLDTRVSALAPDVFEEAVDLAASLLAAAGQPARLCTAGGREITEHFLEALADVRQEDTDTVTVAGSGGRLVLITGTGGGGGPAGCEILALGPGTGAERALRSWNEKNR